jgi:hypothetical protein
MRACVLDFKGR